MQAVSYSEWQTQSVLYSDRKTKIELVLKDDKQLIRKTTNLKVVEEKYAEHELKFMMGINHPNVVTYIHHQKINDGRSKLLRIYMPYYPNSDLQSFLIKHDPPFAQRMRMFIDILVGLQQLHSRFIIHRDIKLKNIFVSEDRRCVIADLGISTTSVDSATSMVGTFCYNAPQIYSKDCYDQKVDVWATGIIAYQLFNAQNGHIPFPFIEPQKMLEKINTYGQYIDHNSYIQVTNQLQHCSQDIPKQIQSMIERMLQNNPKKRISWIEFYSQGLLSKYDIGDRLCTFKGDYAIIQDTKITYKHTFEKIRQFQTTLFQKLRHILSKEHRHYFQAKYPVLKHEIQAVNRVYLKLLTQCVQFYKQMKEKKMYDYGNRLKPFYKAVTHQLSDIQMTVRHWDKLKKDRNEDYSSKQYFHSKYRMIIEMIDEMDEFKKKI